MIRALLLLIALAVFLACGSGDRGLKAFRMRRWGTVYLLLGTVVASQVPAIGLGEGVKLNLGGFVGPGVLGGVLLYRQRSASEVWRTLIASLISAGALMLLDLPAMMMADFIFLYYLYIQLLLVVLPSLLLTGTLGGSLAGCIFSVLFYGLFSGFVALGQGEEMLLGGEQTLVLTVYGLLTGIVLCGVKNVVHSRRRPPVLILSRGRALK